MKTVHKTHRKLLAIFMLFAFLFQPLALCLPTRAEAALVQEINYATITTTSVSPYHTGSTAVAIGDDVYAKGTASIAMGAYSNASGQGSVAMGWESYAYGLGSVAFGHSTAGLSTAATNDSYYSFAAGLLATASGQYSVAMGDRTNASGLWSVAMGKSTNAVGYASIAMGSYTNASGNYSVAMGRYNNASGHGAFTAGGVALNSAGLPTASNPNTASGRNAVAFGEGSTASGTDSFAMGHTAGATGNYSAALGYGNTASGAGAFTAGGVKNDGTINANTASGRNAVAFGEGNTASGKDSFAAGMGNTASGNYSVALGKNANATQESTVAIGYEVTASGAASVAMGNNATAAGANSFAFGGTVVSAATNGVAIGNGSSVTGSNSVALGANSVASAAYEVSVGKTGDGAFTRKITNVTAGSLASDSTEVVVGSQLNATNANVATNTANISALQTKTDTYDTYITSSGLNANSKTISSVAAGAADTDAVNLGQLKGYASITAGGKSMNSSTGITLEAGSGVTLAAGTANNITISATGGGSVDFAVAKGVTGNDSPTATQDGALGIGYNAVAGGDYSTAVGFGATVASGATNSVAIGNGSSVAAAATYSVALGANSVASEAYEVSVGSSSQTRKISNVTAVTLAKNGTYAATTGQLYAATTMLDGGNYYSQGERITAALGNVDTKVKANETSIEGIRKSEAMTSGITEAKVKKYDTYVTSTGLNANDKAVSNVSPQVIENGGTNAATTGQIYAEREARKAASVTQGAVTGTNNNELTLKNANGTELATVDMSGLKTTQGNTLASYFTGGIANSATKDASGNVISTTYAKAADVDTRTAVKINSGSNINTGSGIVLKQGSNIEITTSNNEITIKSVGAGDADAVHYEKSGSTKTNNIVLEGQNAGDKVTIKNVAAGDITSASSTDAVNGGQLYATNQNVTANTTAITANSNAITALQGNFESDGTTAKAATKATQDGAGNVISTTYAKSADVYTQTAADAKFAQKATTLSGYGITDAYTKSDVYNKTETYTKQEVDAAIGAGGTLAVGYTDATKTQINLGTGAAGSKAKISNLAEGTIAAGGADAVTTGQLYTTNQNVTALQGNFESDGATAKAATKATQDGAGNVISTTYAKADDVYTRTAVKINSSSNINTGSGIVLKQGACIELTTNGNEVTITSVGGSDTDAVHYEKSGSTKTNNIVLEGQNASDKVTIKNVAAGTADTDAVNYGQIKGAYINATYADSKLTLTRVDGNKTELQIAGSAGGEKPEGAKEAEAKGEGAIAMGYDSQAKADGATALGYGNTATGKMSTAVGYKNVVTGSKSGAFGDPNTVSATGSYAIGNDNTITGDNTFVLGSDVKTSAKNAVVLGAGSAATRDNTVSVGAAGAERQITNVAAGTAYTDAANMGQLWGVEKETREVAAMSGALAGLHYLEPSGEGDDRVTGAVAYGGYRGESAAAVGVAYKPSPNVMVSASTSVGNSQNIYNAGVSVRFGKGKTVNRAEMAKQIKYLSEENNKLKSTVAEQGKENAVLKETLKGVLERLEKLEKGK